MNKNSYLIKLSESEHSPLREAAAQRSEPQRVFSAIWALESQVNNGGFLQYFVSSDFDTANFAPKALRTIGAQACASVVERALLKLSPTPLPDSREACERLVKSLSSSARKQFEKLDSDFMAYPDNLTDLLFAYVASHPEAFGLTPK